MKLAVAVLCLILALAIAIFLIYTLGGIAAVAIVGSLLLICALIFVASILLES